MLQTLLLRFDHLALHAIHGGAAGSPLWAIMVAFTLLGSGWSMLALVPLIAARRTRPPSVALLATLVATAVVVFAMKRLVARVRPCNVPGGAAALWGAPTDFSFPSGHSAGSFACAAFVATVVVLSGARGQSRLAAFMLFAVAALVALSRVYLGVHYPSDVLGGALVGSALGIVGARGYARTMGSM